MEKVKWGILSTAKIGVEKVIPAMQASEYAEIAAIASRNAEKAQAVATQLNIPHAYGSYEELLADPGVDAVYAPLPNHLHIHWSIEALKAGKHVLCEKPIGLTAAGAQRLLNEAKKRPQLKVMEAFMYRHHPQWQRAKQLVTGGRIGALKAIQSFFSYNNPDPANIRNRLDLGGGGLMDIGCYCLSLSRFIFDKEPQRVFAEMEHDPQFKTDRLTAGMLDFGPGLSAFTCATQLVPYQRVNIFGSEGRVEIEIPFNAPTDKPCKMWHQRGTEIEEIVLDACNQYSVQADLFSLAVLNDTEVPTPLEDAVANMRAIEAVVKSGRNKTWTDLTLEN